MNSGFAAARGEREFARADLVENYLALLGTDAPPRYYGTCRRCGASPRFVNCVTVAGEWKHWYVVVEVLCEACKLRDAYVIRDWWVGIKERRK